MTEYQEEREKRYDNFTYLGALRFAFYITAGVAMYMESLKVGAVSFIIGASIGLGWRLYNLLKDR